MKIRQMFNSLKNSIKCPYTMTAEYITIHNTANDASANNEVSYMLRNDNQVSFHIAVDDIEAVQGIPFNRNSWNAGDGANGIGNRKSISIEICYSKSGGDKFIKAEQNCAELVAQLLKERGWGIDRVKKHQDWSGKYCPHRTLDMGWTRFLNMIQTHLYSFSIQDIETKKVILTQDTYLYNFDKELATEIKSYQNGTILDVSAIATTTNGTSYYLTDYSYTKNINNGFSISFCKDYIEPVIEELEPLGDNDTTNSETTENEPLNEATKPISDVEEVDTQDNTQDISKIEEIPSIPSTDKKNLLIQIAEFILKILGGIYEKLKK